MAIVNVTGIRPTINGYLTRSGSPDAELLPDTYVFPKEQDYLEIINGSAADLFLNVGKYQNIVIHTGDTWANSVDFTTFDIYSNAAASTFAWTTMELDNTPVTISNLWNLMELRDKASTGLLLKTANAGSSAAAVNAAIAGAGFTRTVTVTMRNTADSATHTWFNGQFPIVLTNTGAGTTQTTNGETFVTLIDGVGTVDIQYFGAWVATNTATVTITGGKQLGYTLANKTSVDTLIA
jgi:hypothetical protein